MSKDNASKKGIKAKKEEIELFLNRYFQEYECYSRELSVICRQLAFAEGALFWFSKQNLNASDILVSFGFGALIIYFIFDALQYFVGMRKNEQLSNQFYRDYKVNKNYDINNYEIPENHHLILNVFFYFKLIMISLSSALLIYALGHGVYKQLNCTKNLSVNIQLIHPNQHKLQN